MHRPGVPSFKVVPQHVARNPVARAMQRQLQRQAALDYQVYLHTLSDGADAASDVVAAGTMLLVAYRMCQATGNADSLHAKIIRGAIGALQDIAASGYVWRTRHINAVDQALCRAVEVYDAAPADLVQRTYMDLTHDIERRGIAQVQTSALALHGAAPETSERTS